MLLALVLMSNTCKKGCSDPNAINYDQSIKPGNSSPGSCVYHPALNATTLDCQVFSSNDSVVLLDLGYEIDYIIDCKMAVHCDLKIMPGVAIVFKTDAGLHVYPDGSINAEGTVNLPINFNGYFGAAGSWAGIFIDSDDVKNKFRHCLVYDAGGDSFNSNGDKGAFILYAQSTVEISNTIIYNSADYGINANYSGGTFIFNNNVIGNCSKPMFICGEYGGSISGGDFSGNTIDAIYIDTYSGQNITTAQTWTDLGVPYRMKGGYKLTTDTDWTLSPGVVMEFEAGSSLYIADNKSLKAVGTNNKKIIFKGVNSGQGTWRNIYFNGSNVLNEIAFAEINNGGEDPTNTKGSVFTWYNAQLNIHDVSFSNNLACGVYVRINGTTPNPNYTSSNLTFSNNTCNETFGN
jgi:hypothetical protein